MKHLVKKIALISMCVISLSACAAKEYVLAPKGGPDELLVTSHKPLEIPPSLNQAALVQPQQGDATFARLDLPMSVEELFALNTMPINNTQEQDMQQLFAKANIQYFPNPQEKMNEMATLTKKEDEDQSFYEISTLNLFQAADEPSRAFIDIEKEEKRLEESKKNGTRYENGEINAISHRGFGFTL